MKPGWVALQRLVNNRVEIYSLPPEHRQSLKESLAKYTKPHVSIGDAWDRVQEAAWQAAAEAAN